jgi:hypothetical protein
MKREKISLFILVVEIALIAFLHSAKQADTSGESQVVSGKATVKTYELNPATSVVPAVKLK